MQMRMPVSNELSLTIGNKPNDRMNYPTSRLAKGLALNRRGLNLAEEAVGFGVPLLMRGLQALFPGEVELHLIHESPTWNLTAEYSVNRVELLGGPDKRILKGKLIYAAKNYLSALRMHFPSARDPLMAFSSGLRRLFGWETTFEQADFSSQVKMTYLLDERTGLLSIEADLSCLPSDSVTEVIIMNEQGAHYFDEYRDSSGIQLSGKDIGCWDEVTAEEAGFASATHRAAFTLPRVPGARLFRGRELVDSRLAWSGFGYSFPPTTKKFSCTVKIETLP